MAEKKAVQENQEAYDVWQDMVDFRVPRKSAGDGDSCHFISINGRNFFVPKDGKVQSLPRPVYEILAAKLEAEAEVDEFIDGMPNAAAPI